MRRRQLKWLWTRLGKLAAMNVTREEMLMKLGAARSKAPSAWRLVDVALDKESAALTFSLNRQKLRIAKRREGRYLLRTNQRSGRLMAILRSTRRRGHRPDMATLKNQGLEGLG